MILGALPQIAELDGAPGELGMSSRPTRLTASAGASCQATCEVVAKAIEAALAGQKAIESEGLVLECAIRTYEVFLF
jgi:hypothetical protein